MYSISMRNSSQNSFQLHKCWTKMCLFSRIYFYVCVCIVFLLLSACKNICFPFFYWHAINVQRMMWRIKLKNYSFGAQRLQLFKWHSVDCVPSFHSLYLTRSDTSTFFISFFSNERLSLWWSVQKSTEINFLIPKNSFSSNKTFYV